VFFSQFTYFIFQEDRLLHTFFWRNFSVNFPGKSSVIIFLNHFSQFGSVGSSLGIHFLLTSFAAFKEERKDTVFFLGWQTLGHTHFLGALIPFVPHLQRFSFFPVSRGPQHQETLVPLKPGNLEFWPFDLF